MAFLADHNATLTELSDRAIQRSIDYLRADDELTIAMREALRNGVSADDLSEMTGLTTREIRRRTSGSLNILEDFALLA